MSEDGLRHYLTQVAEMMKEARKPLKGYRYHSCEEFLLAEGTMYSNEPLTDTEERILLRAFQLTNGPFQTKDCYGNALRLVVATEILKGIPLRYAAAERGDTVLVELTTRRL